MTQSIKGTPKKRGRPRTTGRGLQIGMRWQDPELELVDHWIGKQKESFTRSEAIRRLVELGLTVKRSLKLPTKTEKNSQDETTGRRAKD